ncbi:hypothetical protein BDW59DRAFT_157083 [Aspergillus cavernicola]|uniref:Uncharacterized protein n=1 Tax=Aspergillus cavernicola TaxID=176166 RepID=A0ABR4IYX9_9EURO
MDVIPIALGDQQNPVRNIRSLNFFIIDGRHNEPTLKDALDSLIRDHWRKLGARLVSRPIDGLLEYHLPQTFAEDYLLFNWSYKEFDHTIDRRPELSLFHHPRRLRTVLSSFIQWLTPSCSTC